MVRPRTVGTHLQRGMKRPSPASLNLSSSVSTEPGRSPSVEGGGVPDPGTSDMSNSSTGWETSPSSPDLSLSPPRSEEHTSELQSLMRNTYAVLRLKKKN